MEGALECQRATQSRVLTSIDREFIQATDKHIYRGIYTGSESASLAIVESFFFEHMSPPYWAVVGRFVLRLAMFTNRIICRHDHDQCGVQWKFLQ